MQSDGHRGMWQPEYRGTTTKHHGAGTVAVDVLPRAAPYAELERTTDLHHSLHSTVLGRRCSRRCAAAWRRLVRSARGARRAWQQPSPLRVLLVLLLLVVAVLLLCQNRLHELRTHSDSSAARTSFPLGPAASSTSWEPRSPPDNQGWYQFPVTSLAALAAQVPETTHDARTARPRPGTDDAGGVEDGAFGVEEPRLLPGVVTHYRTYTADERLARYADMTVLYSFVNGSDASHAYRRAMLDGCGKPIFSSEMHHFAQATLVLLAEYWATMNSTQRDPSEASGVASHAPPPPPFVSTTAPWAAPQYVRCFPRFLGDLMANGDVPVGTVRAVVDRIKGHISPNSRDRETDELRHSLRSVETHMRWHRGRVVLVSPGHHPQWVDAAKNFLASRCRPSSPRTSAAGRNPHPHVRVTTVHQDALLPYGMHLTLNSHTVEKYLWRVHNLTSVHLYFNDDYFVNRDTAVTDFVNSFGGTIIRTERALLWKGFVDRPKKIGSWAASTTFTQYFNTLELDVYREDHLPALLQQIWAERLAGVDYLSARVLPLGITSPPSWTPASSSSSPSSASASEDPNRTAAELDTPLPADASLHPLSTTALPPRTNTTSVTRSPSVPETSSLYAPLPSAELFARLASPVERLTDVGIMSKVEEEGPVELVPRRVRRFATHAPFAYCTAMHRYLAVRYERELAKAAFQHRHRHRQDLLMPFIYNAFAMVRPWSASPKYLQYLFDLHAYRTANTSATASSASALSGAAPPPPLAHIYLDNEDGCAPPTLYSGPAHSQCVFAKFLNDKNANEKAINNIRSVNPLFFNINAGFSEDSPAQYLRAFLREKFPDPSYLEGDVAAKGAGDADDGPALRALYDELMALPLVLVTSYAPGVCPLVRSLQLSLADHRGPVLVVVHRAAAGEDVSAEASVLVNETLSGARRRLRHRVYNGMPVLRCTFRAEAVRVLTIDGASSLQAAVARAVHEAATPGSGDGGVVLPERCGGSGARRVRGFVVDARARRVPPTDYTELVHALTMPGQTLALEDFATVPLARNMSGVGDADAVDDAELRGDDVLLSLSVTQAESGGVHWVFGASESDLLLTYPLPVEKYEDMSADASWI